MSPIALVTSSQLPDLDPDSQLLLQTLHNRGIDARPVVWSDPEADWSAFPLTIIRSPWDYHYDLPAFMAWLDRVEPLTRLYNPAPVIRWNSDKVYLRELERKGVAIVPTEWFPLGDKVDLPALLERKGWDQAVVKPAVSAAGRNTEKIAAKTPFTWNAWLEELPADTLVMVQPFIHSISDPGELSLIYFNGRYSHAVIKKPAPDGFKIHEHFGGVTEAYTPNEAEIAFGEQVLQAAGEPLLYGRVDAVYGDDGTLLLAELEVFEPNLYFKFDAQAADRMADQIEALTRSSLVSGVSGASGL